mmetsp:Transcript_3495/g.10844  ORF Transcript_3495/g.10844 Transcript_3495/m.10844 type:complete len:363 (-) Transcript_3495:153-1241(-)
MPSRVSNGTSSRSMGTRAMALSQDATSAEPRMWLSCMAAPAQALAMARAALALLQPSPQNSRRCPPQGTRPQSADRHRASSSGGPGRVPCNTQTRKGCKAWSFRMSAMMAACSPASSAVGNGGPVSKRAKAARAAADRAALLRGPAPVPRTAMLPSKTRPQTERCCLPPGAKKGSASMKVGPCSIPMPSLATMRCKVCAALPPFWLLVCKSCRSASIGVGKGRCGGKGSGIGSLSDSRGVWKPLRSQRALGKSAAITWRSSPAKAAAQAAAACSACCWRRRASALSALLFALRRRRPSALSAHSLVTGISSPATAATKASAAASLWLSCGSPAKLDHPSPGASGVQTQHMQLKVFGWPFLRR